ncbi:MAG: 2,3-bisphosphoglycerate-independent phosphoglycerate mutase, partial [Euryarchaeota archaeon]|nr:2,3-bisphosphoglycerate-independent phosphoglycerate mutase [Euryarchaeota archaeon]
GMADDPLPVLGGKTPLEYAHTPNMDLLAHDGAVGQFYAVEPGIKVDSDAAHLAMLGQQVDVASSNRGAYEALGAGFTLGPHDLGFRVNFATINDGFTLIDGRAGRIKGEAKQLERAVNEKVKLSNAAFEFRQTLGFKGALVLKNNAFTVDLRLPTQYGVGTKIWAHPLIETPHAIRTAETINEFMLKSYDVLKSHPLNLRRIQNGDPPANVVMPWAVGKIARLNPIMDKYGKSLCVAAVPVIKGVCKYSGMDIIDVPRTTGEYDTDTLAKGSAALEHLEAYDVILIHVEGTDEASHDGNVEQKLVAIEKIDAMIGYLLERTDANQTRFALLSDHGSSCLTHDHMKSSVPLAIYGWNVQADGVPFYDERSAPRGRLDTLFGKDLLPVLTRARI